MEEQKTENDDAIRRQDVINLAKSLINGSVYFGYPTLAEFIEKVNHLPKAVVN